MDRYFKVVKRAGSQGSSKLKGTNGSSDKEGSREPSQSKSPSPNSTSSFHPHVKSSLNGLLLKTLSDEKNPITHSDLADRSDKVLSTSTGHQVTEDTMSRKRYFSERQEALKVQHQPSKPCAPTTGLFRNTRIYINGYLEGTTDIEIKRIVTEEGGTILFTPSARCTHVVTSNGLSGSKTQKHLKSLVNKPFIVKPDWVLESVASGRRRAERHYAVRTDQTLRDFMRGE